MKNVFKTILFLAMIQLIAGGIIYSNIKLISFGCINALILIIWMGLDSDFSKIKELYIGKIKNFFVGYDNEQEYGEIFGVIGYFVKHFLFSVSMLILIFALMNNFIFKVFDMKIGRTIFWFAIFTILNAKNILSRDIFLGNKRLFAREFIFFISLFLFVFIFSFLKDEIWWYKTSIAILTSGIFYMIFYGFFGLGKLRRFFADKIVRLYVFFDIIAIAMIAFFNIDYIKSIRMQQKIVEKEVIKTDIIKVPEYVCTGNQITGEALTGVELTGSILTGTNLTGATNTGSVLTGNTQANIQKNVSDLPTTQVLTYKELIPFLVSKFNLKKTSNTKTTFSNIPQSASYYNDFLIAYQHKLFGKNSNPDAKLKCENLAVLVGLIQGWKVEYTSSNIFDKFWAQAQSNGFAAKTGCKSQNSALTNQNLNF